MNKRKLKILFVSSEVVPFAKSGGLADVAGSLPQHLATYGHSVKVAMPYYARITKKTKYETDFPVIMKGQKQTCVVRKSKITLTEKEKDINVPVYLLNNHHYFDREGMYCHHDDAERFAFFCKAVIEMLPIIGFKPDVIHCNDWHSGPIPFLLKYNYNKDDFYKGISTVFTIHNLQYQGNYSPDILEALDIEQKFFNPDELEFYGQFSFMKTGIQYADVINTVSETYSKEIQTPEFGENLDGLLRERSNNLYGIVNGINFEYFNPKSDTMIYKNYDIKSYKTKKENKYELQKEAGLPVGDTPLIGLVSRLVDQKGLDLINEIFPELIEMNLQFIVLGTGSPYYEEMFEQMQKKHPERVSAFIEYNEELAQRIYAGSDIFLMPSRFEPCGLGQLISLRYGTIPIVRETGGLSDTIIDYNSDAKKGNGFSFKEYSSRQLLDAIKRCLDLYNNYPQEWISLIKTGMKSDFSWHKQAEKYINLYYKALEP
jgi:starch synthase